MKRYLLFEFDTYYPTGGWNDFVNSFDTVADALAGSIYSQRVDRWEHFQIVDSTTGTIVEGEGR